MNKKKLRAFVISFVTAFMVGAVFTFPDGSFAATEYKTPNGKIAEALSIHDKVVGGKPGDQSGNELKIRKYKYSKGARKWKFVVRCTDPEIANFAASYSAAICKNNKFGYNNYVNRQSGIDKRNSLYWEAKKVGFNLNAIPRKVDTSCTPLSIVGFRAAGINMDYPIKAYYKCRKTGKYTGIYNCGAVNAESLKAAIKKVNAEYRKQGQPEPFVILHPTPKQFKKYKKYLKRGDVVCTGKHTAILQ